jgi:hypothetical protein
MQTAAAFRPYQSCCSFFYAQIQLLKQLKASESTAKEGDPGQIRTRFYLTIQPTLCKQANSRDYFHFTGYIQ